jgi:hypothetical protein
MRKEQAEKIAEEIYNKAAFDNYGDWRFLNQDILKKEITEALTSTSVKLPSEELIRQKCRENAQLILDHHDKLLRIDGVEDLLYSLVRGLFPNPDWAIKRMQENE